MKAALTIIEKATCTRCAPCQHVIEFANAFTLIPDNGRTAMVGIVELMFVEFDRVEFENVVAFEAAEVELTAVEFEIVVVTFATACKALIVRLLNILLPEVPEVVEEVEV
jgi:hypothetical protein